MASLYAMADALLLPSQEEGFGIPMLEAGLFRLPIFCSDIPALRATGRAEAHYFSPEAHPELVAALIGQVLLVDRAFRMRRRARSEYRWERIVHDRVIPLIEGGTWSGR
jgi:glycosyltransferase involved in cell wall biosynthesis